MSTTTYLDQFLEPMTAILSPDVARQIVAMRASPEVQSQADEWARKANEGTLTAEEEAEYKQFVEAVDILSIIQAKARRYLAQHGSSTS